MTAQPARPLAVDDGRPSGLKAVSHIIAVSSCKGGAHTLLEPLPLRATLPPQRWKASAMQSNVCCRATLTRSP